MAEFPQAIIDEQGYLDPLISIGEGDILSLNNPVWEDLRVSVNNVRVPSSNSPDWVAFRGSQILAFGDQAVEGNEEIVYFAVQLPHTWREGFNLDPHIHWVVDSAVEADVVWKLTYSWANISSAFPSETTLTVTDSSKGGDDTHVDSHFSEIDGTGKTLSSMLLCSLRRNSSNAADTLTGVDALLLEFDFHYQVKYFGSRTEDGH